MKTIPFEAELAFGIAKCTNNLVSKNLDDYMFMYADPKDLYFKHIDTREYVKVNHQDLDDYISSSSEWIY